MTGYPAPLQEQNSKQACWRGVPNLKLPISYSPWATTSGQQELREQSRLHQVRRQHTRTKTERQRHLQEGRCLLDVNLDPVGPGSQGWTLQTQTVCKSQRKLQSTPALGPPTVSHTFFSCGSRDGEDKSSLGTTSDFCFQIGNSITGSNFL